ncbi:MAG: DUF4875 domain-containing protein [Candidatus Thiodiazotropha sp.]
MKKFAKGVFKALKMIAIVILGVIVFNRLISFVAESSTRESANNAPSVERALGAILDRSLSEKESESAPLQFPLKRRKAAEYAIAESRQLDDANGLYRYACAISSAAGKQQRAQTMINVALDLESDNPNSKYLIYLAPHEALCETSRLLGMTYYAPADQKWSRIKKGQWKWYILTTNTKVTENEIHDTVMYEENRAKFKDKYSYQYSEKLIEHIEKTVGRKASFVNTGMWVDDYHLE